MFIMQASLAIFYNNILTIEREGITPGNRPRDQKVLFGEIARFDCSAYGTNVGIKWEIFGVTQENTTGITTTNMQDGLDDFNNDIYLLESFIEIRTAEIDLIEMTLIMCIISDEQVQSAMEAKLTLIFPNTTPSK